MLFFSHPRSEGWPHHGRTFSIYPCPLSFWLTLPRGVLSTYWCCPSRPCVVFLACVHLAWCSLYYLFLQATTLFSHSVIYIIMLWESYSSVFTPALLRTHSFVFFAGHKTHRIFLGPSPQRRQDEFLCSFWVSSFHAVLCMDWTPNESIKLLI